MNKYSKIGLFTGILLMTSCGFIGSPTGEDDVVVQGAASLSKGAYSKMSSKKGSGVSTATGWSYKDGIYQSMRLQKYQGQPAAPGLVFIEGGSFTMGTSSNQLTAKWNNTPRRVSVSSFYMDQYEVSNKVWKEYLQWLKMVYHNRPEVVKKAQPDVTVWYDALSYNDQVAKNYFSHPAYNEYPVVGVSWGASSGLL